MKKIFLFFLIGVTYPQLTIAQQTTDSNIEIKGRITDMETNEPIPFAHVFVEGTLIGTTTDLEGRFILLLNELSSKLIVVSAIGYESQKFKGFNPDRELNISLDPNVYMLDDVVIKADNLPIKRKMRMFESYFLGLSGNAENSVIVNPEVLDLYYDKKAKTLHATASEPIIIDNYALGYRIIYDLQDFLGSHRMIKYTGNYYFSNLIEDQRFSSKTINSNRKETYLGSRLHLIRSIWNKDLKNQDFNLFYNNYKKVKIEEVIADLPTKEKIVCFRQGVIVYYGDSYSTETSYLTQINSCTKIAKDGYFEPESLQWSGDISEKRVADLLPYEFKLIK
jgi:hypothetical protein